MAETATTRRGFLAGVSATALLPLPARGQTPPRFVDFAARCREVSGFDPIARPLLRGAAGILDESAQTAFVEGHSAAGDVQKDVLKALYTGMHRPRNGDPERFAYAEALMYAAIEDTVNVPSYCGGLPGYWAEKPSMS